MDQVTEMPIITFAEQTGEQNCNEIHPGRGIHVALPKNKLQSLRLIEDKGY